MKGMTMYHPTIGAWMQRDPLDYVDDLNLYEAAISNPTNFTDPTGEYIRTDKKFKPGADINSEAEIGTAEKEGVTIAYGKLLHTADTLTDIVMTQFFKNSQFLDSDGVSFGSKYSDTIVAPCKKANPRSFPANVTFHVVQYSYLSPTSAVRAR